MKKCIFCIVALSMGVMLLSSFRTNDMKSNCNSTSSPMVYESQSSLVFRGTQKLKSNDGEELWLYQNSKCEWWVNDACIRTGTYTHDGKDVKIYFEGVEEPIKGSIYWNSSHSKPLSIRICGKDYRNKE